MALAPGTPVPDIALPLIPEEAPLRLWDYCGHRPVVVFFVPFVFSSSCAEQLESVQKQIDGWAGLDAAVLGICVDSPYATQHFTSEVGLSFPLLSDFNREAVTAFDVRTDGYTGLQGIARRSVFVVDRDGIVTYSWVAEDPDVEPDFGAIEAALRSVAGSETNGE